MTPPAVLESTATLPGVVRAPICDRTIRVAGYELIVQHGGGGSVETWVEALAEVGIDLVAAGKGWIPVTSEIVLSGMLTAKLPAERLVLVATPGTLTNAAAVAALGELQSHNFEIAVDAVMGEDVPFLDRADWIVIDGTADRPQLVTVVNAVRGKRGRLIAKGLQTYEQFDACKALDLDLYQGSFFTRPRVADGAGIKVNTMAKLKLVADLYDPNVDINKLGELVSTDLGLSHGLMRYVNSASLALPRRIESVQHALVMLGLQHVRRWMTTMTLADSTEKPPELLITGLVRAAMMEKIAVARGQKAQRDTYFTTGLFSVIDALIDAPMRELLDELPLTDVINDALLTHRGPMGELLAAIIAYESGDFDKLYALVPEGTKPATYYRQALEWAAETRTGLVTDGPDV
jgi:EAL and modified HD-GYP domain-containing signal transduction protein